MSTQRIDDYLTKQLFINKNIVTYRSLSREFGIHVNKAKNELATFYAKAAQSPGQACSATYLISGEVVSVPNTNNFKSQDSEDTMDMDTDLYALTPSLPPNADFGFANGSDQDKGEVVVQIRLTIVPEAGLEDAKAKYTTVTSTHVYSLSPAPIRDADLLCEPTRKVRETDNLKGAEIAQAVGKIIGEGIEIKAPGKKMKGRAVSRTSGQASAAAQKPEKSGPSLVATTAKLVKAEDTQKEPVKDEPKKPRQTGKLDFFPSVAQAQLKEKGKENSSKNSGDAKGKTFFGAGFSKSAPRNSIKEKVTTSAPSPPSPKEEKPEPQSVKRGTKRKSTAAILSSDEESVKSNSAAPSGAPSRQSSSPPSNRSSPQPTKALSKLRLNKGAILSDDDESGEQPRKRLVKKSRWKQPRVSDDEDFHNSEGTKEANKILKSMMDLDDDCVEKVPRMARVEAIRQEEEEETESEPVVPVPANKGDVDMSDDTEAKPKRKPRKKVEKKVVPVGRNGLKKRRVMKSRKRLDEKGYMVTEDYSSYESVEEEEEEEPRKVVPRKQRSSGKSIVGGKKEKEEMTESAAPEDTAVSHATASNTLKPKVTAKAAASSTTKPSTKSAAKGGEKQKTLNTFFTKPKK